ncbi:MAG: NADH-dependent [FeFe] hydrogenase, group A6 [Candidatus Ratteibacteria bacterium]|nr:NADH-dependent [FeFe] hydrogenase, group A6 [Candidatus Ratteibacteria bacterium]
MINLTIDSYQVQVPKETTVFEAAKKVNINIPHLCYHEALSIYGACRVCVVEVEGRPRLEPSCATAVEEGMKVKTNTTRIRRARRMIVELLLANHPEDCLTCERNQICELRKLAYDLGIRELRFEKGRKYHYEPDLSSPAIIRDPNKCILCSRCIRVCLEIQSVGAIDFVNRGGKTQVLTFFNKGLNNVECTNCGQCILACPTGALREKTAVDEVWKAISNPKKFVIVQTAPAVRSAIGEEFGLPAGSLVTGKMAAALRRLSFDRIFDTQFGADLTIMEEAHELVERIKNKGVLPMITSCSPGWIKYIEHFFPDYLEHLSTCKSPQQMFGPIAKTYYAQKISVKPEDMYVVSIMPCTAKKFEAQLPEMNASGCQDVDAVLTTREAARMIKEAGIDFVNLPDEDFDKPLGISTGAGVIFGATGGVMEAALRTAYEVVTGKTLEEIKFEQVRGMEGLKEAEVNLNGLNLKVAVAHGLSNARILLEQVQKKESPYHFIEVMACPGGCLGGGGQPMPATLEIRKKRAASLYCEDEGKAIRKSHENPAVIALYKEFLGNPLSKKSHHLLHTTYTKRSRY